MSGPGDEEHWRLPDEGTPLDPAAPPPDRPDRGRAGRVACWLAVGFAVLGLPSLAAMFVGLGYPWIVPSAIGFGLGWLGVWLVDRAGGTGRNIGLVAVRISAVCLLVYLAPIVFELLLW